MIRWIRPSLGYHWASGFEIIPLEIPPILPFQREESFLKIRGRISFFPPLEREGVKKPHFHPHPGPPPSRGREFLYVFQYVSPLPWRERVG
jgi:hypothetical protein